MQLEVASLLDEMKKLVTYLFKPFDVSSIADQVCELVSIDDVVQVSVLKLCK